jgi:putative phosphoribosyl transferase
MTVHADRTDMRELELEIPAGPARLPGTVVVPQNAAGIVLFAHGSGSSRRSPRNVQVARALEQESLGTVLFDLLTETEADRRTNVFDIPLLAERLLAATDHAREQPDMRELPLGYFGASTGAAAALWAAAALGDAVSVVVSRGGRPDLAGERLTQVSAPTLLIVGGKDKAVLELNEQARAQLRCQSELIVVPGASHLFEERGALEAVAEHAVLWFKRHLGARQQL